jgi:hypothetical protein
MTKPTDHQTLTLLLAFCDADRKYYKEVKSKKKTKDWKVIKAQDVTCRATFTLYCLLKEGHIDLQALPAERQEQIQRLFCRAEEHYQMECKA